jgi:hypothetical protein
LISREYTSVLIAWKKNYPEKINTEKEREFFKVVVFEKAVLKLSRSVDIMCSNFLLFFCFVLFWRAKKN